MKKRIFCLVLAILVGLTAFSVSFSGAGSELNRCRYLDSYCDADAAFFYGFHGSTLVSERVLPDDMTRMVTADSVIRMASHNGHVTYALLETSNHHFSVLALDMDSGNYTITALEGSRSVSMTGFAADNAQYYIITYLSRGSVVSRFDRNGSFLGTISLPSDAVQLTGNSGSVYAMDMNGDIFHLSGSNAALCASAGSDCRLHNAGAGYLHTDNGMLISLFDGSAQRISDHLAVRTTDGVFTDNSGQLLAAVGDTTAVYDGGAVSIGEPEQQNGEQSAIVRHSEISQQDGSKNGDLNGTGTVNSADVTALMDHLIGKQAMSGEAFKNADMNSDGNVDNRDLVLLAQQVG